MQCPHCAHPDSIRYGTSRGVQRYRCQACRRIFQTLRRGKDPALKQQACQLYLEGMGMRAIGRVLNIHHQTVSRWLVQAAQSLPESPPQTEVCSFIEIDELCTFIVKKKSQCWLWLAVDSSFGKVLGFACGRRTIKTAKLLWQQIKHLPTMGDGTDMLKSYENFIPHAKHYASKTFTTQIESLNCRLRHYLARLHRKTLCYSKSKTMLEVSLKLLIHQLNNP